MNLLQIIVEGKQLDLPPKIAIPYTINNPIFTTEQVSAPHTLDFEAPRTSKNERLFRYPGRINLSTRQWEYGCRILFSAYNIASGTLVLQEVKKETYSLYFKSHHLEDNLDFSLRKLDLANFDLVSESQAESKLTSLFSGNPNTFAPARVRRTDFDESSIEIYYSPPTRQPREPYPFYNQRFNIPFGFVSAYARISPLPCPYVHEVVRGILTHTQISNNYFTSEHLKRLFVEGVSNHFEINSFGSLFPDYKMKLQDFLPDYSCINFIKELMKLYNLAISYDQHGHGTMAEKYELVTEGNVLDITNRLANETTLSREETSKGQKTYSFAYDGESVGDTSKVCYTVSKEKDVFQVELNTDLEDATGDKVYIRVRESGNIYVRFRLLKEDSTVTGGDSSRVRVFWNGKWVLSHHLYYCIGRDWNNPTEGELLKSALCPSSTYAYKDTKSSFISLYTWQKSHPEIPRLNYYRGHQFGLSHISCPFNFDGTTTINSGGNNNSGGFELTKPPGIIYIPGYKEELSPDYIHTRYHNKFSQWKSKTKLVIKGQLLLDAAFLSKLHNTQHFFYQHKHFILKSLKYNLYNDHIGIGELEMVEK